jgi:hypothetical protein
MKTIDFDEVPVCITPLVLQRHTLQFYIELFCPHLYQCTEQAKS